MQPEKDTIRQNRQRIKMDIKSICTTYNTQSGRSQWKTEHSPKQARQVRRRRKTSQNFQSFESMSTLKDIAITQNFDQLFILGQKLGQGAQSSVYKCIELKTNIQYAVKIAKKKDPELFQNMRQCYQVLKQLSHQNIIKGKYLFLNEKKFTCHLVEQYVKYPDLRKYMNDVFQECKKNNQPCSLNEEIAANILKTLLNCIQYMKDIKVCHRDLKPDNILYDPQSGNLKIIDFQISRMQRYKHQKLTLLSQTGTLHYRAPQTFKGGQYGIEIDLWAIGIIAYQMLTGKVPFKSSYTKQTSDMIMNEDPNLQDVFLSSQAKNLLARMLEKNPQKRITPSECLSSPFFLKNTSPNNRLNTKKSFKRVQSFENLNSQTSSQSSSDQRSYTPSRYYDSDMCFSFADTLNQDLGIRFCGE